MSACSGGRQYQDFVHCRFVGPYGWQEQGDRPGTPKWCGAPAAYVATSTHHLRDGMVFLVCVEHAPDVRRMDWLGSLRTYVPPPSAAAAAHLPEAQLRQLPALRPGVEN